jgi:hypothetical protein
MFIEQVLWVEQLIVPCFALIGAQAHPVIQMSEHEPFYDRPAPSSVKTTVLEEHALRFPAPDISWTSWIIKGLSY